MKHKIKISKIGSVAGLIGSIGTLIALIFAIIQIHNNNSTRNADFAHRFKVDFFTEQANNIITLLDNNLLNFKVAIDSKDSIEFGYFNFMFH